LLCDQEINEIHIISNDEVLISNSITINVNNAQYHGSIPKDRIKRYVSILKKAGFILAEVDGESDQRYVQIYGLGGFQFGYGLLYSPLDIPPYKLREGIIKSVKIPDIRNWYTFNAEW